MARKNYSEQFRRAAVDLYESTPGATLKGIAADLGISRGALKDWVDRLGSGTTTTAGPAEAAVVGGADGVASGTARAAGSGARGL